MPREAAYVQGLCRMKRPLDSENYLVQHELFGPWAGSSSCLVSEPGTGKTHLATGLAIAACRQRRRVRFTTAAALVNQLVEAQREQSLSRMLARWSRVELIVIDELGYVSTGRGARRTALPGHRRTG